MQQFREIVRGGFAFIGEVGGEDHFAHDAVRGPRQQPAEGQFLGPDAVERAQPAHQHVIQAVVGMRLLHADRIDRHFDDAQLAGVAARREAALADLGLGVVVAAAHSDAAFAAPVSMPRARRSAPLRSRCSR
jgi:hypothetical protein